jgi:hypothetical protein
VVVLAIVLTLRDDPHTIVMAGNKPTGGKHSDKDKHDDHDKHSEESKIRRGFEISPVELDLRGKNRALVGLGSYIVNAQAACSECHTWPQFEDGGNPFLGQPEKINTAGYLAGGRAFGPIISDNLTPDETGLPAGMTFVEFLLVMRTGIDRDHSFPPVPVPDNDLMQVMPWPVFREMTDRDLLAVYEYLSAIPSVP